MNKAYFIELENENQLSFSLGCQKLMASKNFVDEDGKSLSPSSNTMGFSEDWSKMAFLTHGQKEVKYPSVKKGKQTETWLLRVTCSDDIEITFGQKTNSEHAMIHRTFSYGKSYEAQKCFMDCINFVEVLEKHNQ